EPGGLHGHGGARQAVRGQGHLHPERHRQLDDGARLPHRPEPLSSGGSTMITTKTGSKSGIREKKEAAVAELVGKFESANAVYLADFTGLTVKRVTELRSRLRKAGV